MRELERSVLIARAPGAVDVPGRLIAALGPDGLLVAKEQARAVLSARRTKRLRDVLRTLDDIDEAIARLHVDGRGK